LKDEERRHYRIAGVDVLDAFGRPSLPSFPPVHKQERTKATKQTWDTTTGPRPRQNPANVNANKTAAKADETAQVCM
jgi:hypothetical protein